TARPRAGSCPPALKKAKGKPGSPPPSGVFPGASGGGSPGARRGPAMTRIIALLLVSIMLGDPGVAWAQAEGQPQRSGVADTAINVGHVFATATYVPVKALMCAFTLAVSAPLFVARRAPAPRRTGNPGLARTG